MKSVEVRQGVSKGLICESNHLSFPFSDILYYN